MYMEDCLGDQQEGEGRKERVLRVEENQSMLHI
jgi:hypothetical protein